MKTKKATKAEKRAKIKLLIHEFEKQIEPITLCHTCGVPPLTKTNPKR